MAKAIYNEDGSVTYRGKTFRVGDKVKICRDTHQWQVEHDFIGEEVIIEEFDPEDDTLCVLCPDDEYGYISLESFFKYSEEDEPHQAQPERKPWDMPELKPWMRVTTRNNTYVIAEVDGELVGLRIGGCESLEHLQSTATEVHAPYLHDDKVAHYCALNPNEKGALLWSKAVADMVRNDFEVRIARKQEIQAQIDKLAAELAAIP